jgi:transcription antitermination factor NusG
MSIPDGQKRFEEMPVKYWYALYTRSRSENKAAEQLSNEGISYYLPVITKWKKWSDRKKKITEPLLKGYIFIYAEEKERMLSLEMNSVVRCVFDMGRPARIPEWQINNLKKMLSRETDLHIKDGLIPGIKVKIREGPFDGIIGVIQESDNGNTIAVSIDLLKRSIVAHLPKETIFDVIKDI